MVSSKFSWKKVDSRCQKLFFYSTYFINTQTHHAKIEKWPQRNLLSLCRYRRTEVLIKIYKVDRNQPHISFPLSSLGTYKSFPMFFFSPIGSSMDLHIFLNNERFFSLTFRWRRRRRRSTLLQNLK